MNLKKWPLITVFLLVDCAVSYWHILGDSSNVISSVTSFLYYVFAPGLLLLLSLRVRRGSPAAYAILAVGLSILLLMAIGLSLNWLLPLVGGGVKPLSAPVIFVAMRGAIFALFLAALLRHQGLTLPAAVVEAGARRKLQWLVLLMLPLQSAIGAAVLNGGGTNLIALLIPFEIVVLCIVLLRDSELPLGSATLSLACLSIALALLLGLSLRSSHVIGWDINQELFVFGLTESNGNWNPWYFRDAYNACLSITILPTMLAALTGMGGDTLFKLGYPILASFLPLGLYALLSAYMRPRLAFLAVILFVTQPPFLLEIVMLARQEIGFLMFAAMMVALLQPDLSVRVARMLFLVLGIGMIVSHYSTAYVALLWLVLMYIVTSLRGTALRLGKPGALQSESLGYPGRDDKPVATGSILLTLVVFGIVWIGTITPAGEGLAYTLGQVRAVGERGLDLQQLADSVRGIIWDSTEKPHLEQLLAYQEDVARRYDSDGAALSRYGSDIVAQYPIEIASSRTVPPTGLADPVAMRWVYAVVAVWFKLSLLIGAACVLLGRVVEARLPSAYIAMCGVSLASIAVFLVAPYLSIAYNFERVAQQAMLFLALPTIVGTYVSLSLLPGLRRSARTAVVTGLLALYFLNTTGVVSQLVGGTAALQYNNYGQFYNRFYLSDAEVASMQWLASTRESSEPIYADTYARLKFISYGGIDGEIIEDVLPSTIAMNAYVYASRANVLEGLAFALYKQEQLEYAFPQQFLSWNKDKVYSNGYSEIYR